MAADPLPHFDDLPPGMTMERVDALVNQVDKLVGLSDNPRVAALRTATYALVRIGHLEGAIQRAYNLAVVQMDLPTASILHEAAPGEVETVSALRDQVLELQHACRELLAAIAGTPAGDADRVHDAIEALDPLISERSNEERKASARLLAELSRSEGEVDDLRARIHPLREQAEGWQDLAESTDRDLVETRKVLAAVMAVSNEFKHAVEHVASCGDTCEDCRRVARSALSHDNLADFRMHANPVTTRRAARMYVRMTIERLAHLVGVPTEWTENDAGKRVGAPKTNRELFAEACDRVLALAALHLSAVDPAFVTVPSTCPDCNRDVVVSCPVHGKLSTDRKTT